MPPGTPLPQEMAGASTLESVPANERSSARAAKRQTARMNATRRMRYDFNPPLAPSPRANSPRTFGCNGVRGRKPSTRERVDAAFLRRCQFKCHGEFTSTEMIGPWKLLILDVTDFRGSTNRCKRRQN